MTPTIRPETDADHRSIRRVVVAAFESEEHGDLVEAIRTGEGSRPGMALVAVDEHGEIVGHVMISDATLRSPDGTEQAVAMLSPLAVAPPFQRRGIGAALVAAVTSIADGADEPFVVLEGDPGYYRRLGFVPAADHGITMPLPDWAPAEAAQVMPLRADDPSIGGVVVYPSAFDDVG